MVASLEARGAVVSEIKTGLKGALFVPLDDQDLQAFVRAPLAHIKLRHARSPLSLPKFRARRGDVPRGDSSTRRPPASPGGRRTLPRRKPARVFAESPPSPRARP